MNFGNSYRMDMSHKEIRVIDQAFPHTCLSTMPVRHGGDRSLVIVPKW